MIDFYNAFISYRHADLDSKIAAHVQKQLEHFHVPHKLRKKLKHEKITRIFRDKDELPITSDLTETITEALRSAEYLIVICSTNTKESIWVKREINTFLTTHTRDKVLTVLCDGEPFEVIPEELLSTEKEYIDENGVPHTIKVPIEPLSCDYRLPRSTADKEELPRLASALLGCSYDELQRRRRQYRIRRAAAIVGATFAALVAFGCYMGYTSKKINDHYIESLRSRSLYLANESEQLLEDGFRTDAIHVALAALPNDSQKKMPVTGQAVRAITDATAAYKSNRGSTYKAIWNYKADNEIKKTILSDDCFTLAALDKTGGVYCWDTTTHELLFTKPSYKEPVDLFFMEEDSLLIVYKDELEAYNVQTGTRMWNYVMEDDYTLFEGYVLFADHSVFFADSDDKSVLKLSSRDGSVQKRYVVQEDMVKTVSSLAVSPDGKKLAFADSAFIFGNENINIYDTETGNITSAPISTYYIWKMEFVTNDCLCVLSSEDIFSSAMTLSEDVTYVSDGFMDVTCFNTNMSQTWNARLNYNDVATGIDAIYLPARDAVLCYVGNTAAIFDVKSGNALNVYKTGSSIVTAVDHVADGLPEFICRHGEYLFAINAETNDLAAYRNLCYNIHTGAISDFIFAVGYDSTDIICYNRFLEDGEWTAVEAYTDFTTGSDLQTCYSDDEYLVIAARVHDSDNVRVSVIDTYEAELIWSEDVPAEDGLLNQFCFKMVDEKLYGIFGYSIYYIDPEGENIKLIRDDLQYDDFVSEGKVIKYSRGIDGFGIEVSNLDGSDLQEFEIDEDDINTFETDKPVYCEILNKVFIPVDNHVFVADLDSEKLSELDLPDTWNLGMYLNLCVTASDDGKQVMIADGNVIIVMDGDLEEEFIFDCNYSSRFSATFKGDLLYVITDERLTVYSAKDGSFIAGSSIELFGFGEADWLFDDANHLLFITIDDQISIFDTDSWVEIAFIENSYCYHPGSDRFFVYSYWVSTTCTPGYLKHYTLDELVEKANNILNDHEMPEVLSNKYGI